MRQYQNKTDRLCDLVVRVPAYNGEVRTEFIYVM
jgi:hypothetical protein